MPACDHLTTARILAVFAAEVATHHGDVSDAFDDGQRLFARSVLPRIEVLARGDWVQGGVALRANEQDVWLHPYLFRLVCRNGAIIAHTLATRHLCDLHLRQTEEATRFLREAVESCCAEHVFMGSVHQMRSARETQADLAVTLMPLFSRLSTQRKILSDIMARFFRHGDQSRFGLINAVTSVARDAHDPELRWDLEEVGGAIAIGRMPGPLARSENVCNSAP